MVSNIYKVKTMYELQRKKKIGTSFKRNEKIFRSKNNHYFTYDKDKKGKYHKVNLKANDLVYSRAGRIAKYEPNKDKSKISEKTFDNREVWKSKRNQGDFKGSSI